MSADFYRAFEDRHRGSREAIQERQRVYLPWLAAAAQAGAPARLADLGCGRGEWLALAGAEGWQAQGVDLDDGMLAACRDAGLDARRGDALEFLRSLPEASLGAITSFHVVEHMPFDAVQALLRDAWRALAPGGLLVLETPNPENLQVGTNNFYLDPTHVRPIPSLLLSFAAEHAGFGPVATLRLHELVQPGRPIGLVDVLTGASPDYAIVARKPGGAPSPDLDALFAQPVGVSLSDLANRLDQQSWAQVSTARQVAEAARSAALAAQLATERQQAAIDRQQALIERNQARLEIQQTLLERHGADLGVARLAIDTAGATRAELEAHIDVLRAAITHATEHALAMDQRAQAMMQSTSWRVTAPLRWIGWQLQALRRDGLGVRLAKFGRKLRYGTSDIAPAPVVPEPEPEPVAAAPEPAVDSAPATPPVPAPEPAPTPLAAEERQVYARLQAEVEARETTAAGRAEAR